MGDSFKLWGNFGESEHDAACDAERRAMCDFLIRRLLKGGKHGNDEVIADLMSGGSVAMAGLFVSSVGGVDALPDDAFDRWIAIMTFAWYQAVSAGASKA